MKVFIIVLSTLFSSTVFGNGETGVLVSVDPLSQRDLIEDSLRLCEEEYHFLMNTLGEFPKTMIKFTDDSKIKLITDFHGNLIESYQLFITATDCE